MRRRNLTEDERFQRAERSIQCAMLEEWVDGPGADQMQRDETMRIRNDDLLAMLAHRFHISIVQGDFQWKARTREQIFEAHVQIGKGTEYRTPIEILEDLVEQLVGKIFQPIERLFCVNWKRKFDRKENLPCDLLYLVDVSAVFLLIHRKWANVCSRT